MRHGASLKIEGTDGADSIPVLSEPEANGGAGRVVVVGGSATPAVFSFAD